MKDFNKLAVKHGVCGEYKIACKKESDGAGNGWRVDIERALDAAEKGEDIDSAMRFWCDRASMPVIHTYTGLRYRDYL